MDGGEAEGWWRLRAFADAAAGVTLAGRAERAGHRLAFAWLLDDPHGGVRVPARAAQPTRADGLWRRTCFEAFFGVPGASGYWELNLSPAGDWNLYRFAMERDGMAVDARLAAPEGFQVAALPGGRTRVAAAVGLDPLVELAEADLELGLAAVLEDHRGGCSYWAIAHPRARPDFHARESFVVHLPRR